MYCSDKMLNKYLAKYWHPEATKRELNEVIQHYRGLRIRQERYYFIDGAVKELVNLQGTIPINYKRTVYNIPVCIWIMDTHPNNAPMCFLRPTKNMTIKVSRHVDFTGKIFMPYLCNWSPGTSNLMALIQILIVEFSEDPPLYEDKYEKRDTSVPYPRTSLMPLPQTGATPYAQYHSTQPPNSGQGMQPLPTSYQHYLPPYPTQSGNIPPYPVYPSTSTSSDSTNTGTITGQHIHASLLSAVEDKVKRSLREHISQTQAELETLDRIQQELIQGKNRLDHLISKLDGELNEWEKNLTILRDKERELDVSLSKLSDQGAIDVDEAVTTTAPLYNQLLNSFAEEAATEDVIYYLGEALRRGVIDLDVFLRNVRSLSRKQFMLRALMQKCRAKAGLAG